jgi:hypothetical protein
MNVSSPVRGALSPQRVNSLVAQSGSNPWSPAPLDATHYQRTAVDPLLQSQTFTKSSEVWQNNNPYIKTSDTWLTHNPSIKSPEVSLNNNPYIRSPDAWLTNNPNIKSSDAWSTNNPQIRSSELWLQSNTLTKPPESTLTSNNSSNAQMIKRFEKVKKIYRINSNLCFLVQIKHLAPSLIDVHLVVNLVYLVLLLDF